MRFSPTTVIPLVLALAAFACQPMDEDQGAVQLTDEDTEAIRSSTDAFVEAVTAANWDSVAALYTEDAVVMPPNAPAVTGRSAIREWLASFPPISAFDLQVEEVEGRGDLAYARGTLTMELNPPGAANPIQDRGKYIEIRRRQEDGSWLISRDIFNSNQAPAGQGAAADTAAPADTAASGGR